MKPPEDPGTLDPGQPVQSAGGVAREALKKRATVLDEAGGVFGLEYDNTLGKKHTMRLDATTYEGALLEARAFLGIAENDCDEAGDLWTVE